MMNQGLRDKSKDQNSLEDEQKRNPVFLKKAKVVLIKVDTKEDLGCLVGDHRTMEQILEENRTDAERLGINEGAYGFSDTGKKVVEGASNVTINEFVAELQAEGYRLVSIKKFQARPDKDMTSQLTFVLDAKPESTLALPERFAQAIATRRFGGMHVWANSKTYGRLDTINCHLMGPEVKKPGKRLAFAGEKKHSYRLLDAVQ